MLFKSGDIRIPVSDWSESANILENRTENGANKYVDTRIFGVETESLNLPFSLVNYLFDCGRA